MITFGVLCIIVGILGGIVLYTLTECILTRDTQTPTKVEKNVYQAMMDNLAVQDKHRLDMQRDFNTRWENYPRR